MEASRIELPILRLGNECSIHLSYGAENHESFVHVAVHVGAENGNLHQQLTPSDHISKPLITLGARQSPRIPKPKVACSTHAGATIE